MIVKDKYKAKPKNGGGGRQKIYLALLQTENPSE